MRFITHCTDCGPVVLAATAICVTTRSDRDFTAGFVCPVCQQVQIATVARQAVSPLVAHGATVNQPHRRARALELTDLVMFHNELDDAEACRRFLDKRP